MEAREQLAKDGIAGGGGVDAVLGTVRWHSCCLSRRRCWVAAPRVAVEARGRAWLGALAGRGRQLHRHDGASAPRRRQLKLFEHFGITAAHVAAAARQADQACMTFDKLKSTAGLDLKGKRVLVRADLNVPVKDAKVSDATRLERLLPGLKELAQRARACSSFRTSGARNTDAIRA